MSTVKITDLPYIPSLQSNTSNTILLGVDVPGNYTGQLTLTTLAGGLYSNNNLKVGNNDIIYANAVGQFTGNSTQYLQVAVRNQDSDGSGDFVVTADDGTDGTHYLDLGLNGSTYSDPDYSATEAHDGYLYVSTNDSEGNLVLGTTSSSGRVNFIVGGTKSTNIVSYISSSGIYSPSINSLVAANVATLRGEITANATSANSVINSRISSNIATANLFTQAAFDKANNALANTSSIHTAGDFYTSGSGFVNGTFILANSNFSSTEAAMTIKATATVQTPINPGYMLHISGKANTPSRIVFDSFSTDGSAYGLIAGRTARGTVVTPTATQNNDVLMRVSGNGYGTSGWAPLGVARIDIIATENYTDLARGSRILFYNIPTGSNVVNLIASFNANSVEFTGTVNPQKGFIYTPNVLSTITSFTLDFQRDNLIKFNVTDNLTITLSNYVYGKVVEMWITNSAAQNKTITHGCLANNATSKATTFTILSNSCAYLRYFSIDGDQANTFVSITA